MRWDFLRINTNMKKYLDELVSTELKSNHCSIDLNGIENIIFPTFFEWDGCILLRQERNDALPSQFLPNQFIPDRTAFEAEYNHIHLNDIFDEVFQPTQILQLGIKILEVWAAVLYRQFDTKRNFILILSYDGEEIVLRFYTVRENEAQWLDTSSLESYLDGLMVIEI
jgi:hypothetical protein